MKYLKLFESFEDIDSICQKYNIENYTINSDGSIDVDGSVNLYFKGLTKLPLKFGNVTGYFVCFNNKLISLEGAPRSVTGDFSCSDNQLISLEGAPQSVGGIFACSDNQLINLKGAPRSVGGDFKCNYNELISLEGAPQSVGSNFYCHNNHLTSLEGAPQSVGSNFYCHNNQLISLEGAPRSVGGDFYCYNNPVSDIWELFNDYTKMDLFLDYDIIQGEDIVLYRLNDFLQEIGKYPVESVEGYNNI